MTPESEERPFLEGNPYNQDLEILLSDAERLAHEPLEIGGKISGLTMSERIELGKFTVSCMELNRDFRNRVRKDKFLPEEVRSDPPSLRKLTET